MWRRFLSSSSKLPSSSSFSNPSSLLKFPVSSFCSASDGVFRPLLSSPSLHRYSSSSSPPPDSIKLSFQESHGVRAFSTAADFSNFASGSLYKTREVVDFARHYGRCYWELSKARLSMLVVATSGTGYVLGSGSAIDLAGLCWTCTGTMMVAAAANSLNQVFEVSNDAKMKRTQQRPLPSGRITIPHAVTWASSVGLGGVALLATKANMLAAGLAASNLILYAFIYTPLKQIHPVNTWVGAVVGAIPPLLGWAASSGHISLSGLILPAALYFWQIPHFMALAYLCRNDYAAGGFRMYSLGDASGQRTAAVALRNCLYLIPLGFLACDWGVTSGWFSLESSILTVAISATAFSFYRHPTMEKARRMFHASLLYLPVFMSGLLFHRLSTNEQHIEEENSEKFFEISDRAGSNDPKLKQRQSRPPVSYASVAPFPFLPAPAYAPPI